MVGRIKIIIFFINFIEFEIGRMLYKLTRIDIQFKINNI